ncbi:MAG: amidohydrolase family protein, partial [Proteobacteria bacterium]|nr:amidohydrolase family protein [Pseudomonadota bacterium]
MPSNGQSERPLCVSGALVLRDWNATPEPAAVLIENGLIAGIAQGADQAALAARAAETIDAAGLVLMPGLVNAHYHAYSGLLRGTENSLPLELWALYTVAYGRTLDADAIRLAILLGAAEMIRSGVTAYIDHFPHLRQAE